MARRHSVRTGPRRINGGVSLLPYRCSPVINVRAKLQVLSRQSTRRNAPTIIITIITIIYYRSTRAKRRHISRNAIFPGWRATRLQPDEKQRIFLYVITFLRIRPMGFSIFSWKEYHTQDRARKNHGVERHTRGKWWRKTFFIAYWFYTARLIIRGENNGLPCNTSSVNHHF